MHEMRDAPTRDRRLSYRATPEEETQLRKIAIRKNMTLSDFLRHCVKTTLELEKKK